MSLMKTMMCGAILCVAACGDDGGDTQTTASATFTGTNGQTVAGTATFTQTGATVTMVATFTAGPAGMHGLHIHNVPMCGNEGMDAGPHWDDVDTSAAKHGLPPNGHLGDMGNITLDANGGGTLTFSNAMWTLGDGGPKDVNNRGMIFHQSPDDGMMPSAGMRYGCAIIALDD
jgi:superoxide dismutase, Cu-Zn family